MDPVGDAESIPSTSHRLTHMMFTGDALYSEVQPSLAAFSSFTLLPPLSLVGSGGFSYLVKDVHNSALESSTR